MARSWRGISLRTRTVDLETPKGARTCRLCVAYAPFAGILNNDRGSHPTGDCRRATVPGGPLQAEAPGLNVVTVPLQKTRYPYHRGHRDGSRRKEVFCRLWTARESHHLR